MSSDISINSGTHNQASEVPDEQPTSATPENGPDLEALREPQDHSPESLWPSIDQQLSSSIDSLGIQKPSDQQHESPAGSSQSSFMNLPPEMKEEVADKLSVKDLLNLSSASKSLHQQFRKAAYDSLIKSNDINETAKKMRSMDSSSPEFSSKFDANMKNLSSQRPADQAQDLKNIIRHVPPSAPPDQAAQLWSELLKHPIDQHGPNLMLRLNGLFQLPVDKSSGIVNGLLDQIEKQSKAGTLPEITESSHYHPLEIAAMMVEHMPAKERQAAADRIRAMAQSQNLPLEMVDDYLKESEL